MRVFKSLEEAQAFLKQENEKVYSSSGIPGAESVPIDSAVMSMPQDLLLAAAELVKVAQENKYLAIAVFGKEADLMKVIEENGGRPGLAQKATATATNIGVEDDNPGPSPMLNLDLQLMLLGSSAARAQDQQDRLHDQYCERCKAAREQEDVERLKKEHGIN